MFRYQYDTFLVWSGTLLLKLLKFAQVQVVVEFRKEEKHKAIVVQFSLTLLKFLQVQVVVRFRIEERHKALFKSESGRMSLQETQQLLCCLRFDSTTCWHWILSSLNKSLSNWAENGPSSPETQNRARGQNISSIGATATEIWLFYWFFWKKCTIGQVHWIKVAQMKKSQ